MTVTTFFAFGLGIGVAAWAAAGISDGVAALWRRLRPPAPPPAKWSVTLTDPDGIPMRTDSVSAEGIARIIKDLNSGYYK
jgi:hypothetical protein